MLLFVTQECAPALRPNLHRRAHWNQIPDLVDLLIGDGDATQRPVVKPVRRANIAFAVGQAVNQDGPAGRDAQLRRTLAVLGIWIGDVQSLVVVGNRVLGVDDVVPFRRTPVALTHFGRKSSLPQRHLVRANQFAPGQQLHHVILLQNQNRIGLLWCTLLLCRYSPGERQKGKAGAGAHHPDGETNTKAAHSHSHTLIHHSFSRHQHPHTSLSQDCKKIQARREQVKVYCLVAGKHANSGHILNNKEISMASFCAKCGSALSANEQFCKSCGAAAATGSAAPAQTAAAPASSTNSAVKIILIIVAVIVVLGVLALGAVSYVGYRVARAVHVSGPNGQVSINTPGGTITANPSQTYSAAELGTDIYPGAQSTTGGMKMSLPTGSMVIGSFLTSDSRQQVIDFYKSKFGAQAAVFDTADGAMLTQNVSKQESVMVTVTTNQPRDKGQTRITITHTINTKAP